MSSIIEEPLIDTHCHLTSSLFHNDMEAVLSRARAAKIKTIVCVSESLQDAHGVIDLCQKHPDILCPALGLHPEHVSTLTQSDLENELSSITSLIETRNVAVIGEVGLDFTPRVVATATTDDHAKRLQRHAFARFINLSAEKHLPMTVHSRGAGHHALTQIIETAREKPLVAVMHAFDGRPVHAENGLKEMQEGLYFSIPPSIVRSKGKVKLVKRLPLERILLESDAPALPAEIGARNEPSEIRRAMEMIAAIKGVECSAVRSTLYRNTATVFPSFVTSHP